MLTFEEWVLGANSLQQSGSGSEPYLEPNREFGPIANTNNARTARITISSEAVSAAVLLASWEQSRVGAQFTAGGLIIPRISLPGHVPLFNELNSLLMYWRLGYCLWHGCEAIIKLILDISSFQVFEQPVQ